MKLPKLTRRQTVATIILIGGVICLVLLVLIVERRGPVSGQSVKTPTSTPNKSNNAAENTPAENPAPQPPAIESSSPACRQFTPTIAKTILGSKATISMQDSAVISDTPDIRTSTCTYQGNNLSSIKLTAYTAKTSVGVSTNSLLFGSGKPGGVQDVPGYGQAAYWDQTANILFILKDNNRYDLNGTVGSSPAALDDVLHAANSIVPKL